MDKRSIHQLDLNQLAHLFTVATDTDEASEVRDQTPESMEPDKAPEKLDDLVETCSPHGSVEQVGSWVGPYKLVSVLGEGGMGIVYLADQKQPIKRRVALKIIKPGMDSKQVIARFEAERQALALLDHPNIAHVYDAGTTENGRPYFVMECVQGVPITEHCDRYKLTITERLELFVQVCEAVQHGHQKGIIHRDIKPSNVQVAIQDQQSIPKIIDFGVAKAISQPLTERTLVTEQGQFIGTPEYMSPEQAEMTGQDVDTRSDIYSLGVLLYELLTGILPFDSQALREGGIDHVRHVIREQEPKTPSTRLSTISGKDSTKLAQLRRTDIRTLGRLLHGDLDWITLKAMDKDRTRRYQTAHAFAEDIQRYLNQEPVLAGCPGKIYRLRKLLRRHRTQLVTATAIMVLISAVIVVLAMYIMVVNRGKEAEFGIHEGILARVQELSSKGQYQEAVTLAEESNIINSKYVGPEARLLHARLTLELRNPSDAVKELQELLNERREIACQAHFLLGRIYLESNPGDPNTTELFKQKARNHQQKGLELFSESADAYFNRAMLAGAVNKTMESLKKALSIDPSHYPSLRARALAYYAMGDYRNMERDAVAMATLRNSDYLGYSLMAIAQSQTGDFDTALKNHNRAIELSPDQVELFDQRCQTYIKMGYFEQALRDTKTCIRLNPDVGEYHFNSFCCLVALGQYPEAQVKYKTIVDSGLMKKEFLDLLAAKCVTDMLDAGLLWHPKESKPDGPAFLAMHDSAECYHRLAKIGRRVVPEGFHPTWSPDGNRLAYSKGIIGSTGIEILNLKDNKTHLLTVPGYDPAWSPDGNYIAFGRDQKKLLLTELANDHLASVPSFTERTIWLIKADGTEEPRLLARGYWTSWSSDSKRVFYYSQQDSMLYSIATEEGAKPIPFMEYVGSHPVVSPDGKYVVDNRMDTAIIEVTTQSVFEDSVAPMAGRAQKNWSPDGRELIIGGEGLWAYSMEKKTAFEILHGSFIWSSWFPSDKRQLAITRRYNNSVARLEVWVVELDPNVPAT